LDKIIKIKNVLKNKERKKLIKDCQPYLLTEEELLKMFPFNKQYVEKQTLSNLHTYPQFVPVFEHMLNLIIKKLKVPKLQLIKSWINCLNGKDTLMHNHVPFDYSVVYYIKTFPFLNNGTFFKNYGLVRCPQNSLIVFPSYLDHSNPSYRLGLTRYTLAMDLKVS
tara:strand:+ start:69 stop:563 length:495 start_codon:yes stop_codon:yes gene_type:complete